jgi:uncharacterized protein YhhL (DUF1145 family)
MKPLSEINLSLPFLQEQSYLMYDMTLFLLLLHNSSINLFKTTTNKQTTNSTTHTTDIHPKPISHNNKFASLPSSFLLA